MTSRPTGALRSMIDGFRRFRARLDAVDDHRLLGPTALPGWSGRHLLAHVGDNAAALRRLTRWAATGEPSPMYPSASARAAEIEAGAGWPVSRLRSFVDAEQAALAADLDALPAGGWAAIVRTAQGRAVPAAEIPWLRARELWVHGCDLPPPCDFADLPAAVVDRLLHDALEHRRTRQGIDVAVVPADRGPVAESAATVVQAPAADLARWLTGRGTSPRLRTGDGSAVPDLPPWL